MFRSPVAFACMRRCASAADEGLFSKSIRGCGKRGIGQPAALPIFAGPQEPPGAFITHGQTLNRL